MEIFSARIESPLRRSAISVCHKPGSATRSDTCARPARRRAATARARIIQGKATKYARITVPRIPASTNVSLILVLRLIDSLKTDRSQTREARELSIALLLNPDAAIAAFGEGVKLSSKELVKRLLCPIVQCFSQNLRAALNGKF